MNITDLEIIQATIDAFFFLFCIIMLVSIHTNNVKQSSMKIFMRIFRLAAILFLGEALAFIFRGNTGIVSVIITRGANAAVFAMNVAMADAFVRYVSAVFHDKGLEIKPRYVKTADILSCVNMFIIVVNLFFSWMYYFDEGNNYHRGVMWYVYTVISLDIILLGTIMAIRHRKSLQVRSFVSILMFSVIPIIATIVQMFIYGFAIVNFGLGIGAFIMFIAYLHDWANESDDQIDKIKATRVDGAVLLIIMLLSMSASIVACTSVIRRVTRENSEMQSRAIAEMASSTIVNEFTKPITVSQTISQDLNIIKGVSVGSREEAEAVRDEMTEYLISFGDAFGYPMVFAVADKTRAYFTYNGISKYLDVVNDPHDIWYQEYLDSGKKYVVNVDTDEDNNWDLSVFVNHGIFDKNGELLGVCGAGVKMNNLIDIIFEYEEKYGIKISLVAPDGLIQVDSDVRGIQNSYLSNEYFNEVSGEDFYYQSFDEWSYMTKYLEDFDWYLVIRDDNPMKIDVNKILVPIILIFVAGIMVMAVSFIMISMKQRKAVEAYNRSREVSVKDELTGLYNRRGYEIDCEIIRKDQSLGSYSVIMMDLNGLKAANDSAGHEAGDELIVGSAKCMSNAFSKLGNTYRVGGDEFVALLKGPKESVEAAVETLDYLTANFKGRLISELSISKGVVICAEHPELEFEEIKALADKLMYEDKDEYYRRTGKKRRT